MRNLDNSHLDDELINDEVGNQEGMPDFYTFRKELHEKESNVKKNLDQQICNNLADKSVTHVKLEYEKEEVKMKNTPLKIIQPEEDELCINELVIEIETSLHFLKDKSATLLILNTKNEIVEEKKYEELTFRLIHELSNYKPGRYYWKLIIDYDTWVGRIFICTPFYYTLLKNTF